MAYPPTNLLRTAWILILVLSIFPDRASGAGNGFAEFAQRCGATTGLATARVFSDNDKGRWKEYRTPEEVPEGADWSETAYVWARVGSAVVIDVEGLGQDFGGSTYYCFNASGGLSSVEFEFRTAWDWGFAESRKLDSNGRQSIKSHFFNMRDRKEIPRPQDADAVRRAMTLKMYKRLSDMPFSPLLARGTETK